MPKTIVETKITSAKVSDSKFDSGAKTAAKDGAEAAVKSSSKFTPGAAKKDGYSIELKVTVEIDAKERKVKASCKWEVYLVEAGERKLFPSLKQSKAATATVDGIDPSKVTQANVDDAASAAAEAEVSGILKKLP